jgi:RNA recognition motif-containing protein
MVKKNNLFVGNLNSNTTYLQLGNHFAKIGTVLNTKVAIDRDGKCKGHGFIEMSTEKDAIRAMEELNNTEINGMKITILEAKPQ